jgi:hypothetical protein
LEWQVSPNHGARLLRHRYEDNTTPFSNRQWALDWTWRLVRRSHRALYTVAGLTRNDLKGVYEFRAGLVPPDGPGDYRSISQSGRTGFKAGVGFQWSRHWAVEADYHYITLATTGPQALPASATSYAGVSMILRFGSVQAAP